MMKLHPNSALETMRSPKPARAERSKQILFALIELHLHTAEAIASNTLRQQRFAELSAATIRNHFAQLEREGFLYQHHTSSGRVPTSKAYQLYARAHLHCRQLPERTKSDLDAALAGETREVIKYLHMAAEMISETTHCAVFFSQPYFDQDFLRQVKLLQLDRQRILCVCLTDFGFVRTEILPCNEKLSHFDLQRIEDYFRYRLAAGADPLLPPAERQRAGQIYQEVMIRHYIHHASFAGQEVRRIGFSKLLRRADFHQRGALASGLELFEDATRLRKLLEDALQQGEPCCWIGDQLAAAGSDWAIIAAPYHVHQTPIGVFGLLGPLRMPYKHLFAVLDYACCQISKALTKSLYKFKISYRHSDQHYQLDEKFLRDQTQLLLEDQRDSAKGEDHG